MVKEWTKKKINKNGRCQYKTRMKLNFELILQLRKKNQIETHFERRNLELPTRFFFFLKEIKNKTKTNNHGKLKWI